MHIHRNQCPLFVITVACLVVLALICDPRVSASATNQQLTRPTDIASSVGLLSTPFAFGPTLAASSLLLHDTLSGLFCRPGPAGPSTYCGVRSLYLASRACGKDIAFADLIRPEYISSKTKGSSLADLKLAANRMGLQAKPVGGMNSAMLREVTCPAVLHIKSDPAREAYDHWVLFMGTTQGKARIYDGVDAVDLVAFPDLASVWDGNALLISSKPISLTWLHVVRWSFVIFYAGIAALLFLPLASWSGGLPKRTNAPGVLTRVLRCAVCQTAAIFALTCAFVFIFGYSNADGFLSSQSANDAVKEAHLSGFLPKISAPNVQRLLGTPGVTLVDSRWQQDYELGHLPNAINIPPNVLPDQCREIMRAVPAGNMIIIYCQSKECPYSDLVARKLHAAGYENMILFRAGWDGWRSYKESSNGRSDL